MPPVPPPPRAVRPTHPVPGWLKLVGRAFLVAVFVIEAALILALLHEVLLVRLGHKIMAPLISVHEHKSASGSYHYTARYTVALPGRAPRVDESRISYSAFGGLSKPFITRDGRPTDIVFPTTIPAAAEIRAAGELGPKGPREFEVRAYEFGPVRYSRPVEHEWGVMFLLIPMLFAPIVWFLCWTMYLAIVARPRRRRWLYTDGTAVPGVVTERRQHSAKYSTVYFVYYAFTPAGETQARLGTNLISGPEIFERTTPGQPVTVLYDPDKPRHNTTYEFGGYAWA